MNVTTIETYWRCCYSPNPTGGVAVKRGLSHYLRLGLLSFRRDGAVVTLYRRRKLRIWLCSFAAAALNRATRAGGIAAPAPAMPHPAHAHSGEVQRSVGFASRIGVRSLPPGA